MTLHWIDENKMEKYLILELGNALLKYPKWITSHESLKEFINLLNEQIKKYLKTNIRIELVLTDERLEELRKTGKLNMDWIVWIENDYWKL